MSLVRSIRSAGTVAAAGLAALAVAGLSLVSPASADNSSTRTDPVVAPRPIVSGWFGSWTAAAEIDTLVAQSAGSVPEVNTFWFRTNGASAPLCAFNAQDDRICQTGATPWTNPNLEYQRTTMQAAGIKVFGTIVDYASGRGTANYIATPANRTAFAAQITDYAVKAGLDGIDLDFEKFAFSDGSSSWPTTKPNWIAFITLLGADLHAAGKLLSVTVPGGLTFHSDGTPWDSGSYWVYAWSDIIGSIDRLRIMAYDYSWDTPGPIGPNDWADLVVKSAIAQIGETNAGKIWAGQPQYGRDWKLATWDTRTVGGQEVNIYPTAPGCPANWRAGTWASDGTTWVYPSSVRGLIASPQSGFALAASAGVTPTWNADSAEWSMLYPAASTSPGAYFNATTQRWVKKQCTPMREAWWGDTKSAVARATLVAKYHIGGIAVWNLEDANTDTASPATNFYTQLVSYGKKIAPQPVTINTSLSVPKVASGTPVTVTATLTSAAGFADGQIASLWFRPAVGKAVRVGKGAVTVVDATTATIRYTTTPASNGSFVVRAPESWGRQVSASEPLPISVKWVVESSATKVRPRVGDSVRVRANVTPVSAGTARLLRKVGRKWVTVLDKPVTAGFVSFRVKAEPVKSQAYKIAVLSTPQYFFARSVTIVLWPQPRA